MPNYHATINCCKNVVKFKILEKEKFKFESIKRSISYDTVLYESSKDANKRLWRFSSSSHLCYKWGNEVREYVNNKGVSRSLFDDLSSLHPIRKIDLSIELKQGTESITKASYIMEIKEL